MTTVAKKPRKKKSVEDELREKLWATFEDLDQDNSGTLTIDELIAMCKSMNVEVGAWKLRDLLKEVDLDGSGDITFDEFVTALGGHLMRGGDAQQSALGSIFAAKTGAMFGDLWNNASSIFTTPFKSIVASPFSKGIGNLFTGDGKQDQQQEEGDKKVEPQAIYGQWDLSCYGRPRKAATPKRSDNAHYSPPKSMRENVPRSTFTTEAQAKGFFSAPRRASSAAHKSMRMERVG